MATNLYETLGIPRNASTEEIRRAYRRKALETHPDRLPQGASAAEKSASEDMFRKVNNAYEVLSDSQKRATYDHHGVWPPPTTPPQGPFANGPRNPFSDPFFQGPFFDARMDPFGFGGFGPRFGPPRGFTDPFVLFNSIFGDLHRAFETDPFFEDPFGRRGFGPSPFGNGFFGPRFPSMPSMFPLPIDFNGNGNGMGGTSRMQTFAGANNNGRWVSESWSTSTINGRTHTKGVRRDSEGNEHVTYRLPDGTERYTINGIEQPSSQPPRALPPSGEVASSPPPPYTEAVDQTPHRRSSRHHDHHNDHYGEDRDYGDRRRDRKSPENGSSWGFWHS